MDNLEWLYRYIVKRSIDHNILTCHAFKDSDLPDGVLQAKSTNVYHHYPMSYVPLSELMSVTIKWDDYPVPQKPF